MAVLRIIRFICALVGIGLFVFGVAALVGGDWAKVGMTAGAYVVLSFVWYSAHSAIERLEIADARDRTQVVSTMIEANDWHGALVASTKSVQQLRKSASNGAGQNMSGPLAVTLVGHALLLGANGDLDGAQAALGRAVPTLHKHTASGNAAAMMSIEIANEAEEDLRRARGAAGAQLCRQRAREMF